MANEIIGDIYANFDRALSGFFESASSGISSYVIPIAWVLLGICLLVWCYLMMQGRTTMPINDWLLKFIGFMVVLHIMGSGYLGWVARPLFDLPSELTAAMSRSASSAPDLLGRINGKVVDLVSAMFTAASRLISDLAIGPAVALFILGALVVAAVYAVLAAALFSIIFSKLGLSMVLAVGPFFFLGLMLPQTRSYFFSWLNTSLYFVFYQVFSGLFIFMFLGILDAYVSKLNAQLGSSGDGTGVMNMVMNFIGVGGAGLNAAAICIPILLISLTMLFTFLQIPAMCSSLTSGSGGSVGAGLSSAVHFRSMLRRAGSR